VKWPLSSCRPTRRSSNRPRSGLFAPNICGTRGIRDCYSSLTRVGGKRSRSNSLKSCPPASIKVKAKARPMSARADRLREAFACSRACAERFQPAAETDTELIASIGGPISIQAVKIEPALYARTMCGGGLRSSAFGYGSMRLASSLARVVY
jgi:hypothetical protein